MKCLSDKSFQRIAQSLGGLGSSVRFVERQLDLDEGFSYDTGKSGLY